MDSFVSKVSMMDRLKREDSLVSVVSSNSSSSSMMMTDSVFASFCPREVVYHFKNNKSERLKEPLIMDPHECVVVFVDISRFTKLAEEMEADLLGRSISEYFSLLIGLICDYGGDVLKFCGDALLCTFRDSRGDYETEYEGVNASISSACRCALEIQKVQYFVNPDIQLHVKVCIGLGMIHAMLVGGARDRWEYIVIGEPLQQIRYADTVCKAGQIIISQKVEKRLREFDDNESYLICVGDKNNTLSTNNKVSSPIHYSSYDDISSNERRRSSKCSFGSYSTGCSSLDDQSNINNKNSSSCSSSNIFHRRAKTELKRRPKRMTHRAKTDSTLPQWKPLQVLQRKKSLGSNAFPSFTSGSSTTTTTTTGSSCTSTNSVGSSSSTLGGDDIQEQFVNYQLISISHQVTNQWKLSSSRLKMEPNTQPLDDNQHDKNTVVQQEAVEEEQEQEENNQQVHHPLASLVPYQIRNHLSFLEKHTQNDNQDISTFWDDSHFAELSHVTVLFIKIHNITEHSFCGTEEDPNEFLPSERGRLLAQAIHDSLMVIETNLYRFGGMLRQMLCDDKGTVAIGVFGAPVDGEQSKDASFAVVCALEIQKELSQHEFEFQSSIGVATGQAYCGIIGSKERAEYCIVGDTVNTAARIMERTDPFNQNRAVACDKSTFEECYSSLLIQFSKTVDKIYLKNKSGTVEFHYPTMAKNSIDQGIVGQELAKSVISDLLCEESLSIAKHVNQIVMLQGNDGMGKTTMFNYVLKNSKMNKIKCYHGKSIFEIYKQVLNVENEDWFESLQNLCKRRHRNALDYLSLVQELFALPAQRDNMMLDKDPLEKYAALVCLLVSFIQIQHPFEPILLCLDDVHIMNKQTWYWLVVLVTTCSMRKLEHKYALEEETQTTENNERYNCDIPKTETPPPTLSPTKQRYNNIQNYSRRRRSYNSSLLTPTTMMNQKRKIKPHKLFDGTNNHTTNHHPHHSKNFAYNEMDGWLIADDTKFNKHILKYANIFGIVERGPKTLLSVVMTGPETTKEDFFLARQSDLKRHHSTGKISLRIVPLKNLIKEQSDQMVQQLLNPNHNISPKLLENIFIQTKGNPYQIKKICNNLTKKVSFNFKD